MPAPIFGPDQIDPGGYNSGAQPTSLSTQGNGGYWRDYYRQGYNSPGSAPINYQTTNQDQARTQQQQVIQDLQRAAAGDRNSQAQQQLQQGYGAAQSQQSSLGSTMRGQSAGAAMRGVQAGQQGIQRGLAGDQQMLMLQEQQAAQAMLAQLLAQQQGQDITQAQGMAQGTLGSQGMDDAMRQFYLGGGVGQDLAATQRDNDAARAAMGYQDQQSAITNQLFNAGVGAGASALGTIGTMGSGNMQHSSTSNDRSRNPYGMSDHG